MQETLLWFKNRPINTLSRLASIDKRFATVIKNKTTNPAEGHFKLKSKV